MIVAALKETAAGETRVAATPTAVAALVKAKMNVLVEAGAGLAAGFTDAAYIEKGAKVVARSALLAEADVLLTVRCHLADDELGALKPAALLIGFCDPLSAPQACAAIAKRGLSLISMELIPRVTRAQSMDALSSQANIAGYKAVILAAESASKIFPLLMTAAGTMQACRVFVIGAGVAGLQAISTAKRLGAVVSAFDVRAAVKEQVQSVGARFVELPLEVGDAQDPEHLPFERARTPLAVLFILDAYLAGEHDLI